MCSDLSSLLLSDRRAERMDASVGSSSGATGWILQVPIVSLSEIFDFLEGVVTTVRCSPCVVFDVLLCRQSKASFLIVSFVSITKEAIIKRS